MDLIMESRVLGFLVFSSLGGGSSFPQYQPGCYTPLPLSTVQLPQIIKYETEQGLNGYSLTYELTDGTSRREEGKLEDRIWMVFWENQWMDVSNSIVRILSDQNGVSWSINSGYPIAPAPPGEPPPVTTRPPTGDDETKKVAGNETGPTLKEFLSNKTVQYLLSLGYSEEDIKQIFVGMKAPQPGTDQLVVGGLPSYADIDLKKDPSPAINSILGCKDIIDKKTKKRINTVTRAAISCQALAALALSG